MSAIKKSSMYLLILALAISCLLGVFTIMDASSAHANLGENPSPSTNLQPDIFITPTALLATLYPDQQETQTLWITNTGDSPLTYTIYEMSPALRLTTSIMESAVAPAIDSKVQSQVSANGSALVFIHLREVPDLSAAYLITDKAARRQYVYNRLKETASHSQTLFEWLESQGTHPSRFITANIIAATLNTMQLSVVASDPSVKQISANQRYMIVPAIPTPIIGPGAPVYQSSQPDTVEWNIAKIRANEAWAAFDIRGEGVVVGVVDTGVMYTHPALVNSYRGNLGGGIFDHTYSWFDPYDFSPAPNDPMGHGTMMAGVVTGDDGGSNQIGVAPGAKWIAAKACDDGGSCGEFEIYQTLDWMLAPGGDPDMAPEIVFGGWGGEGCDGWLQPFTMAFQAAGIIPVFPGGASGPACGSIGSPADYAEVLTSGATDSNDVIGAFSPRGPSCFASIKPDVAAPGVNIRSSFSDGSYQVWSGTALSSAHLAGTLAMVLSANPYLGMQDILDNFSASTLCIENLSCGGTPCPDGANNVYGYGRLDVYEAVALALGIPPHVNLPWISEHPFTGTLSAGEGVTIDIVFDSSDLDPGEYLGRLGILSSDPISPLLHVPVTLNVLTPPVGPIINIDPLSFSATLPPGSVQTDTLTISNVGDQALTFTMQEISVAGQLLSPPIELSIPEPSSADTSAQVDTNVHLQQIFFGQARLIIYLRDQPDLAGAYSIPDRTARVSYVYDRLLENATQSDDLYHWLLSQKTEPHRLLTANAIAATLDEAQLATVLGFPQVKYVGINGHAEIMRDGFSKWDWLQSTMDYLNTVEWNIARIRADETWSTLNIRGQGAVIGIVDTGVMFTHEALNTQYRGNLGGGNYDHNYNWFDLVNHQNAPYDGNGHGTFGAGIAVGDDGGEDQIGVAPGAKWIAVKALDDSGSATLEDLHAALMWMIAPTRLDGSDPNPAYAPQVVLNMWGIGFECDHTFDPDLVALRAANILPVFAPGGFGPECGYVSSPAANPDAISAGATDINDYISGFSANGPSCYDGSIKPDVTAPGVNVRSSTIDGSYQVWSGTSFSTAHLAGAAAMLFSANPGITLDQLEQTLFQTAQCLDDPMYCGGDFCPAPNNNYGYGRIDVFEAVSVTLGMPYNIPWLEESIISATLEPGESIAIDIIFDSSGMQPGTYSGGLRIDSNDPDAPYTLPATLTVTPPCQPIDNLVTDFTPVDPEVGEVVTFTASATGTLPIDFSWDFGDGNSAIGAEVTHIFTSPGNYTTTLTAQNDCSLDTRELVVPVIEACVPLADLHAGFSPLNPTVGDVVTFTANATGTLPIEYLWDFGDGFTATGEVVTHTFTSPGDFIVSLNAQNACSADSLELVVPVITACSPLAELTAVFNPLNPTIGELVTFTASVTGTPPIDYSWDFGDGATATGEVVTHAFYAAGNYLTTLTAQNECSMDSRELAVPVLEACTSLSNLIGSFNPITPTVNEAVRFTASAEGSQPISFNWDFDDGATDVGAVVTHTFTIPGDHNVSIYALNACDSMTQVLVVPVAATCFPLINPEVGFSPLNPTAGELVTFNADVNGSQPISFSWDFGDGYTTIGDMVTHAFSNPGMNVVSLLVQNPCTLPPLEVELDVLVEANILLYHLPIVMR